MEQNFQENQWIYQGHTAKILILQREQIAVFTDISSRINTAFTVSYPCGSHFKSGTTTLNSVCWTKISGNIS